MNEHFALSKGQPITLSDLWRIGNIQIEWFIRIVLIAGARVHLPAEIAEAVTVVVGPTTAAR
jgi:hypothetical protein